ncbi:HipA domain-containing protein [Brucella sp. C7-11G]
MFHYLVGNADAHGKNYALLYKDKTPELAPLYDVVCTAVYPKLAKQLAMRIGGRNIADTIHLKHWHSLVANTRGAQRLLESDMTRLSSKILQQADALLRDFDDLGIRHDILLRIRSVIETRSTFMARILK